MPGSKGGEQVLPARRPQMSPASHKKDFVRPEEGEPASTILTEFERLFDAAEVIKMQLCTP